MRIGNMKLTAKMPKKYDFWLHFSSLLMILFGTLMIISTNLGNVQDDQLIILKVMLKQSAFIVAAYIIMVFLANNFTLLKAKKLAYPIAFVLIGCLILTLLTPAEGGSRAWIRINFPGLQVTLQPSEFVKVFMIVIMAVYIEIAGRRNFDFWTIVKIPVYFFLMFFAFIVFQKDYGTLLIMVIICGVCFLIPSHPNIKKMQRWLCLLIMVGAGLGIFLMSDIGIHLFSMVPGLGHIAVRIENSINPFLNPYGTGLQLINGLFGIANSNFIGRGIANSTRKMGFLTQADNDFIFSIVIEELGIFGLLFIVIGYIVIVQRLVHYALRTKSEGYKIILMGTAMYIIAHFVLNVGGVSGLIPATGVPLLFISSGGSSLVAIMAALGICQSIIARIRRQGE